MDYEVIKIIVMAMNASGTLALFLFNMNDRKQRATTKSITDLSKQVTEKLDAKCVRITKLESSVGGLPTRDELVRVHERIDGEYRILQAKLDNLGKDINDSSKETTLLIGKLIGQVEQMNKVS